MSTPKAAFLVDPSKGPLQVLPAESYTPGPHELLVRVHAVAINPVDAYKQAAGNNMFQWLKYPMILGNDVAGEVIGLGPDVERFKVGDKVVSLALGMDKRARQNVEGGFQEVMVAREVVSAKMPEDMPYESAAVIPLGLSTAACGLFQKDQLALDPPRVAKDRTAEGAKGRKVVVVWGASTSVGCNAVQLVVAAGYDVIATAGPKSFDSVKQLGASHVFDYASASTVSDILQALRGRSCAGLLAIGNGSLSACIDISSHLPSKPHVAQASIDMPGAFPSSALGMLPFVAKFLLTRLSLWLKLKRTGVPSKFIFGSDIIEWDAKDRVVYRFLEEALAAGEYAAVPKPRVVGEGLEGIQEGMDAVLKGVAREKIVVKVL